MTTLEATMEWLHRGRSSRPSMWLLTFLCLATVARSAAGGAFCPVLQDENTAGISEDVSRNGTSMNTYAFGFLVTMILLWYMAW